MMPILQIFRKNGATEFAAEIGYYVLMSLVDPCAVPTRISSAVFRFKDQVSTIYAYAMRLEKLCALSDNPVPDGD